MVSLWMAALLTAAPNVRYVTKIEVRSWQPIEKEDQERLVETQTLNELGKKGLLRLEKSKFSELAEADFSLVIEGRFIEDAGKFSVYLTFQPQKRSDAPSLYVLDTDEVENKSVSEMQKIIQALTARAARRLAATLEPYIGGSADLAMIEPDTLPLRWGELDVPHLKNPQGAVAILSDVRNEDHERFKALADLRGHIFDQAPARMAAELCVLYDPLPRLRSDCVDALAPVARTRVETQRLLLFAMRNDAEAEVVRAIATVSKGFVGLSRKEALATWMEVLADDTSPAEAASPIADLLREENGVPNLELAVTKCILGKSLAYGKRQACASSLLRKLPKDRQNAVALRFLQQSKAESRADTNVFDDVIEVTRPENYKARLDPALAKAMTDAMLLPRYEWGTHKLLYALRQHPPPDAALVDKLLIVAKRRKFASSTFQTIDEIIGDNPALRPIALERLKRFEQTITYMSETNRGEPKEDLHKLIARLEKPPKN
jgi:hypothetical protein